MAGLKIKSQKKVASNGVIDTKTLVKKSLINVDFGDAKKADVIAYFVDEKGLKTALKGAFGKQLKAEMDFNKFEAKCGKTANLGFINGQKVVFVGYGEGKDGKDNKDKKSKKKDKNVELEVQKLGAKVACFVPCGKEVAVAFSNEYCDIEDKSLVEAYFGFNQKVYRFSKYLTDEKELEKLPNVKEIALCGKNNEKSKKDKEIKDLINKRKNQLEGIFYVRNFGNEPSNVLYPEVFANEIKNAFAGVKNIKVKVLEKKELEKLGMNMLLGVAQGSVKEPKVVVVEYQGDKKKKGYDLALIGKGVCFDSGGLSLKPSQYMEGMKCDMLGAATILSSTLAIANNELKVNLVAVAGLVENMPDGNAQKVGDIVKSMSGKSVEIIDTDAEGRLVLGDILYYAQTTYKPECMIDMATLTGAIMVALGLERAGVFTNNEELGKKLYESGEKTGDRCWVMPMGEEYSDAMKSQIADLRNLSSIRYAGSATAAAFLENFIDDNKNWAHIDIAGVDNATKNNAFGVADFASGYGVKLLSDFVEENIVKKQ